MIRDRNRCKWETVRIGSDELELISRYVRDNCGIVLDGSKAYLVESRLNPLLEEIGCRSFRELHLRITGDRSGVLGRHLIDAITTRETSFFRDKSPFDLLRFKILPDLIDRQSRSGSLMTEEFRIWSAACSTGQEVYSIAIVVREMLPALGNIRIRILGTDISDTAIEQASRGVYSALEVSRGFPAERLDRYFNRENIRFRVRDEVRAMVGFEKFNLLDQFDPLGRHHLIFCRNVAIYFSEQNRRSIFNRMADNLYPGGYLIIGSTESLHGVCDRFIRREYQHTLCYRLPQPGETA